MTTTTDWFSDWFSAAIEPELVEFDTVRGIGVTGKGEPGGTAHVEAIRTLFSTAGPLLGPAVPPLEGHWWTADPDADPFEVPREEWHWQMFLRLPDELEVTPEPPVELVTVPASRCVQVMHLRSYDKEPETLARMAALMREHSLVPNGRHHEIYLTDIRTTPAADLRTILRQPVRPA